MKTKTSFITFLLALLLVLSFSMAVSASAVPDAGETPVISLDESGAPASDTSEETETDAPSLQGETPSGPEAPDGEGQAAEETQTAPTPQKSGNTPFFIGAGIAVLLFIGVALYCKANGNKTL